MTEPETPTPIWHEQMMFEPGHVASIRNGQLLIQKSPCKTVVYRLNERDTKLFIKWIESRPDSELAAQVAELKKQLSESYRHRDEFSQSIANSALKNMAFLSQERAAHEAQVAELKAKVWEWAKTCDRFIQERDSLKAALDLVNEKWNHTSTFLSEAMDVIGNLKAENERLKNYLNEAREDRRFE